MKKLIFGIAVLTALVTVSCKKAEDMKVQDKDSVTIVTDSAQVDSVKVNTVK